jgi:hypothetical protein
MRRLSTFTGALLVFILFPATANAQYPPDQPVCVVDRSRVAPGDELTLTGDRWEPGEPVDIDFSQDAPAFNRDVGGAEANAAGTFVTTVEIPADAHGGPARLVLSGTDSAGEAATCTVALTVTGGGGPPASACAQISDDVVQRSQEILVFSAEGCWEPGTSVALAFLSQPVGLGTAPVEDDGSFSRSVTIPADAELGEHRIRVSGTDASGAAATVFVRLEVVAGSGGGGLPVTGLALGALLALAVGLFAAGGSLVLAARRIPVDQDAIVVRQERERRASRARLAFGTGLAALAVWTVTAGVHPGDPRGLSWQHPVSVGTVLLALVAGAVWWAARNPDHRG